jgi:hypothetical protein
LNFFHHLTFSHTTQNAYKISLVPSSGGRDDENTITLGLLKHLGKLKIVTFSGSGWLVGWLVG